MANNISIEEAIIAINSNAGVSINGSDINTCTIIWSAGTSEISKEDIKSKMAELQTAYDAKEYQRDRAKEYPSWQDQMDMQYHDQVNDTTTWKDAIKAIKDANPKP